MRTLTIVGPGRVGKALARRFAVDGTCTIDQVLARHAESARSAVAFIGSGTPIVSIENLDLTDPETRLLMITTPDSALGAVAQTIADQAQDLTGLTAFHCSGSIPSSVLAPLQERGASIASVHPIKSFSDSAAAADSLADTYFTIEAPGDVEELYRIVQSVRGHTLTIMPEDKAHYHLAIVFVCNYLYTLLHVGVESLERIGIRPDMALKAIAPILRETVENGIRLGPSRALTGPIARGDVTVIEKHLAELDPHPELDSAYRALGAITTRMAATEGFIESEIENRLLEVLKRSPP